MKWFFGVFFSISLVFLAVFGVGCIYGTLFPVKYEDEIAAACEEFGVDRATVYATINVESRFKKDAVSSKGAVGLMQILPATAMELAKTEDFDLFDPQTNISLGTKYLASLIQKFDDLNVAVAAYNAGPATVKTWLSDQECSPDGKTLTSIPYAETRDYVRRFNQSLKYYKTKNLK